MIENLDGRISDERLKEIAAEQPPYSEYLDLCARAEKAEKDAAEWRRLKDQARAELASVKAELAALKAANHLTALCPWCGETLRVDWQNRVIYGVTEPFDDEVSE